MGRTCEEDGRWEAYIVRDKHDTVENVDEWLIVRSKGIERAEGEMSRAYERETGKRIGPWMKKKCQGNLRIAQFITIADLRPQVSSAQSR